MKLNSISEIAHELGEQLSGHQLYVEKRLSRNECSDILWKLIGFLSDAYLSDFLESALSDLSDLDDDIERPEDLPRHDNPNWTSPKLKNWLESDRQHYEMVEEIVKEHLRPEKICDFSFCRFIQIAVWREMDMVYDAVVDYLFEAYNDQEDTDEDEENEDSDLE